MRCRKESIVRRSFRLAGIAALALLLFSSSNGHSQELPHSSDRPGLRTAPNIERAKPSNPKVPPHTSAPVSRMAPVRHFGDQAYQGARTWREGVWRHEKRRGRYGWWWNTGGYAYFYDVPIEGPPDYISEIAEPDSAIEPDSGEPPGAMMPEAAPPSPPHVRQAYYYSDGVLKGTYNKLTECDEAQKRDPHGVCIWK